ncbi:MAG: hypothetical protein A2350_15800 [Candidatus Raymondbacteria bacterium RifOxyB12_full_50_8]|nr:MAG: hypothetical protein A2350_15800 [Candidatus Raymondbacteria bacterium RifOxyB12_full_50_8]
MSADPDAIVSEGLGQACDRLIVAHSLAAHFAARAYTVRPAAGNLLYAIDQSGEVRYLVALVLSPDFTVLTASLGRLLLLKARLCRPLPLIMVLPHVMIPDNANALSHYNVCGVFYAWQGNDIVFEGLSEAL